MDGVNEPDAATESASSSTGRSRCDAGDELPRWCGAPLPRDAILGLAPRPDPPVRPHNAGKKLVKKLPF